MTTPAAPTPLVCDLTTAPDTPQERMAEYGRLFEHALAGRERTTDAVIWRFTARTGVEAWVRDLADREAACCPFFVYTVSEQDGQVTYQIAGDDDPIVHGILDEFHHLPERLADGLPGLLQRLHDHGLEVRARDDGSAMTVTERSGSNSPSVRNRSPATFQ